MNPDLILIRGVPGSGKSTFARFIQSLNPAYLVYEADQFFIQLDGTYNYDPSRIKEAHSWCKEAVRNSLLSGCPTIVANTFIRKWELQPYIDMATDLNISHTILTMDGRFNSIHGVPQSVINRMHTTFEH
jgi:predicted kinase